MKKIALYPGSFDPITRGHVAIVKRSLSLFDKVYVAIGKNSQKPGLFSIEQRIEWIKASFKEEKKVVVTQYEGLTADYCTTINATHIIRGLRDSQDLLIETQIAHANRKLNPQLTTIFLLSDVDNYSISSSIVRDIYLNGGDISDYLPSCVNLKNNTSK